MAEVLDSNPFENDGERLVCAALARGLPSDYRIAHNCYVPLDRGETREIDLIVVAPHAIYLIDVKGYDGVIHVSGSYWYPRGRAEDRPLSKLASTARRLKGKLRSEVARVGARSDDLWIHDGLVILSNPTADVRGLSEADKARVLHLAEAVDFLRDPSRIGGSRPSDPAAVSVFWELATGLKFGVKRRRRFGTWDVGESLGSDRGWATYRGARDGEFGHQEARLFTRRIATGDDGRPDERAKRLARNAPTLHWKMRPHRNVMPILDTPSCDDYVVIVEPAGPFRPLLEYLGGVKSSMRVQDRARCARELAEAVAHVHVEGIVHRSITPAAVVADAQGAVYLRAFEFATLATQERGDASVLPEARSAASSRVQAPECASGGRPTRASDLFDLGQTLHDVLVGRPAFKRQDQVAGAYAQFVGAPDSSLPRALDWQALLVELLSSTPEKRPTAESVVERIRSLTAGSSDLSLPLPATAPAPPAPVAKVSSADLSNLPSGHLLADRYRVQDRVVPAGGLGALYRAEDASLRRPVLLRVRDEPRRELWGAIRERYAAVVCALLDLPVPLRAELVGHPESGLPMLVVGHPPGQSLAALGDPPANDEDRLLAWLRTAAEALGALHARGVTHGDVRPELIWIDGEQAVVAAPAIGFGSATSLEVPAGEPRFRPTGYEVRTSKQLADLVDRDLFALLRVFYRLMNGTEPWDDETRRETVRPLSPVFPLRATDPWRTIFTRGLSAERATRFVSSADLVEALESIRPAPVEADPLPPPSVETPPPPPPVTPVALASPSRDWRDEYPDDWTEVGAFFERRLLAHEPPFDQFQFCLLQGAGGFGRVFLCTPADRSADCAVKIAKTEINGRGRPTIGLSHWNEEVSRLRTISRAGHEYVVTVLSPGDPTCPGYSILKGISGSTLEAELERRGVVPFATIQKWTAQLCDALASLWDDGVRFTDLHTGNVMVTSSDSLKLIDPGVAIPKVGAPPEWRVERESSEDVDDEVRSAEILLQASPSGIVFSLSWIIVQMILGREWRSGMGLLPKDPSMGRTVSDIYAEPAPMPEVSTVRLRHALLELLRRDPLAARDAGGIAGRICGVLLASLSREPRERPQSAREFCRYFSKAQAVGPGAGGAP